MIQVTNLKPRREGRCVITVYPIDRLKPDGDRVVARDMLNGEVDILAISHKSPYIPLAFSVLRDNPSREEIIRAVDIMLHAHFNATIWEVK